MPRPRKPRTCICPGRVGYSALFKPAGTPLKELAIIPLAFDNWNHCICVMARGKPRRKQVSA